MRSMGLARRGAVNSDYNVAPPPVADSTPPSAPTSLVVTDKTDTSVEFSWTGSTDNVSVKKYNVYRGGVLIGTSNSTLYADAGLTASTSYTYTVKALDAAGNISVASAGLVVTTDAAGTPQTTAVLFGANYTNANTTDESFYTVGGVNRCHVARIFWPPGTNISTVNLSTESRFKRAYNQGIRTFILSWKDQTTSHIGPFLDSAPNDVTIYTAFNHEPENDAGTPGSAAYNTWSAQWKSIYHQQAPVMRAHGGIPTVILMGWTLFPGSNRDVADWTPAAGDFDVFGFDGYIDSIDPQDMVNHIVAATKAAGKTQTMLCETGVTVKQAGRATKIATLHNALINARLNVGDTASPFIAASYWNAIDVNGYDCRFDTASANAWFG